MVADSASEIVDKLRAKVEPLSDKKRAIVLQRLFGVGDVRSVVRVNGEWLIKSRDVAPK